MTAMNGYVVERYAAALPISDEARAEASAFRQAFDRWTTATPQQRAEWAREAAGERAAVRAAASGEPLSLDALLGRLGWSREYAEHLVQPYCDCGDGADGWDYCQHARDEGLVP